MKIILLGYMGSGKSTIGKILAKRLDIPFVDLDNYIEARENRSVPEIFSARGELYFRKQETTYLKEVCSGSNDFVLSVGGGTPCYGNNMDIILEATPNVFYLHVPITELVRRLVPEKQQRPLIQHISDEDLPEFIGKHLFERTNFYGLAHHTIYCNDLDTEKIIEQIESTLG